MTNWYAGLNEKARKKLFAWMRKQDDVASRELAEAKRLAAPLGSISVGAAEFDHFIKAEVTHEFLRLLRRGETAEKAYLTTKQYAHECVQKHNAKRSTDVNWQRWTGTADAFIDSMFSSLVAAVEEQYC